jgi:hypothetical protein
MKHLSDVLLVIGAGAMTYGTWRLDPNAAIILGGALVFTAGIARGVADGLARRRGVK